MDLGVELVWFVLVVARGLLYTRERGKVLMARESVLMAGLGCSKVYYSKVSYHAGYGAWDDVMSGLGRG